MNNRTTEVVLMCVGALVALAWAYCNARWAGLELNDLLARKHHYSAAVWSLLIAMLLTAGGVFMYINRNRHGSGSQG